MSFGGRTRRSVVLSPKGPSQVEFPAWQRWSPCGPEMGGGLSTVGERELRGFPGLQDLSSSVTTKPGQICICSSPQKLPLLSYFCYF